MLCPRSVCVLGLLVVAGCSAPASNKDEASGASDLVSATRLMDLRTAPRFFRENGANPTRPIAVGARHLFIGETGATTSFRDRAAPSARWLYETSGTEASTKQVAKLESDPWRAPVTANDALYLIVSRRMGSDTKRVVQRWADPASGLVDVTIEGDPWMLVAASNAAYVVTTAKGTGDTGTKRIYRLTRTAAGRDVVTKLFEAPTKDLYSDDPIAMTDDVVAFVNDDTLFLTDGVAAPTKVAEVPNSYHLAFAGDRLFMTDYVQSSAGGAVTYRLAEVLDPTTAPRVRGYGALPSEPRRIDALGGRPVVFTRTGITTVDVEAGTVASFACTMSQVPSTLVVDAKLYALDKGGSLYVTDGTPAGTKAIVKRAQTSLGSMDPMPELVAYDGGIYYFDEAKREETQLVRLDLATGALTTKSSFPTGARFSSLQAIGQRLVFGAGSSMAKELWTYDGHDAAMIETNPWGNASSHPEAFAAGENLVFFRTSEDSSWKGPTGSEMSLWATDGTPAGTRKVHTGHYQVFGLDKGLDSTRFAVAGDRLCVLSENATSSAFRSAVCTDGTAAGTQEIPVAAGSVRPITVGGGILFVGSRADHGSDILRVDGATGALEVLASLPPGASVTRLVPNADGFLAFVDATDRAAKGIWLSNGTAAGTHRMVPDATFMRWETVVLGSVGRNVYVTDGDVLHVTDGTVTGTRRLGTVGSSSAGLDSGVALGDAFVFSAGGRVWRTSGATLTPVTPEGQGAYGKPVVAGGKAAFKSDTGVVVTDGTPAGTQSFAVGKYPTVAATPSGALLVSSWDKQALSLVSNGVLTSAEPSRKTAANSGFMSVPGGLLFSGPIEGRGMELLFTDGTVGGTRVFAETFLGEGSSDPHGILAAHGKAFFSAKDANGDDELYAVPLP